MVGVTDDLMIEDVSVSFFPPRIPFLPHPYFSCGLATTIATSKVSFPPTLLRSSMWGITPRLKLCDPRAQNKSLPNLLLLAASD